MSEFRIEIGATDDFRFLGIEPPVSSTQGDEIVAAIDSHYLGADPKIVFHTYVPEQGPSHSLLGISAEGYFTPNAADRDMEQVARKVARILSKDAAVQVNGEIKAIGFGQDLFGGRSDESVSVNS